MMYPLPTSKQKKHYAIYECPYCYKQFKASIQNVRNGYYISCGCRRKQLLGLSSIKHHMTDTRLFRIWADIRMRCYNPNRKAYPYYGGRGIGMCYEWRTEFLAFYNWAVLNGYNELLQIDRINNDGDYDPVNCRFVNKIINAQNTRLIHKTNTSGYRGVTWHKKAKRWYSVIEHNNKKYHLGSYTTVTDAASAYNKFVIDNKTYHPLNIIPE